MNCIDSQTVVANAPFHDVFYEVETSVYDKLLALKVGHPQTSFVYAEQHQAYCFITVDGTFDLLSKEVVDMVWPGYTLDRGFTFNPMEHV